MSEKLLSSFYPFISFPPSYSAPGRDNFITSHLNPATSSIRFNPLKSSEQDRKYLPISEHIPYSRWGYRLTGRPSFIRDPLWHAGVYYVQESSSMYIGAVIEQIIRKEGSANELRILDLCASPGGKTTDIAARLRPQDLLISNEIHPQRCGILYENAVKWGPDNIWVTNNQPADYSALRDYFDIIVVDAPCSGSGMWRKDRDTISEWSQHNVKSCADRQKQILDQVIPSLKENGILIYSTCSYSTEENEEVLDHIAAHHPVSSFTLDDIVDRLSTCETFSPQHKITAYRCAPWHSPGEGFFFSAIRIERKSTPLKVKVKNTIKQVRTAYIQPINDKIIFEKDQNTHSFIHHSHEKDHCILLQQVQLKIKKTGTRLGEILKNKMIPDHEWALSIHNHRKEYPSVEVTAETALDYLRRENISVQSDTKGWSLVTHQDHPLGWIKILDNRVNNYYPKNWRIRHA